MAFPEPRSRLGMMALIHLGLLVSLAKAGCSSPVPLEIREDFREIGGEERSETREFRAWLRTCGKVAAGDSLEWELERLDEPEQAVSIFEKAVLSAERRMRLGMVSLPNGCLHLGQNLLELRRDLVRRAVDEIGGKPEERAFARRIVALYVMEDPNLGSRMGLAPADYLFLSCLAPGRHDSLLMGHPAFAGLPVSYSLDLKPCDGGFEGAAVVVPPDMTALPERMRERYGHVGRFVRRREAGGILELTVIDTLAPRGYPHGTGEAQLLKRVFRKPSGN